MKLLLDENLSRRLVPFLVHDYPGTSQVTLLGMEQASDMSLWQYAKAEGFVIVTRDADFQEIATVHGHPPSVIWLKTENPSKAITLKLLLDYRERIVEALEKDGLGVVELRSA
jgi:predicted nuclease of predicted toxin-antitoxin system